jgi:hypothetical protein
MIIAAAAMRCKTMADGSLRIEVEVEPKDAQTAFAMFGRPGASVAMAALKDGYDAKDDEPEVEPVKGGPLAKLAGQWCEAPEFQEWLKRSFPYTWAEVADEFPVFAANSLAAEVVRRHCGVESRAHLDHDKRAADIFHSAIRVPFSGQL